MDKAKMDDILRRGETQYVGGENPDLKELGFWRVVAEVKANPRLVPVYADRLATLDQSGFLGWAKLVVPLWVGNLVMLSLTGLGSFLVAGAFWNEGSTSGFWLLAGMGLLLLSTHGLGHLLGGRILGIQFTHWFIGRWRQPQPGVKIDYATYLAASPTRRAWMHASGALVTKAIPFLVLLVGWWAEVPPWSLWLLVIVAVAQIISDIAWSTSTSDWMKFRRELKYR